MPLDELKELVGALISVKVEDPRVARLRIGLPDDAFGNVGTMYCPRCSEYSGMKLERLYFERTVGEEIVKELTREDTIGMAPRAKLTEYSDPSLLRLDCVNCQNVFYGMIYKDEKGPSVVFFSTRGGGVATANTPDLVRYFLQQAYKAQTATAYSAALAMYRAALEQLLEQKGFEGKLPAKLAKLSKDIEDGAAPTWAKRLNTDILSVIKDISNSHAHPSELAKLQALDAPFMSKIQRTFSALLTLAYEQESRQAAAKAKLEAALQKAKKKQHKP